MQRKISADLILLIWAIKAGVRLCCWILFMQCMFGDTNMLILYFRVIKESTMKSSQGMQRKISADLILLIWAFKEGARLCGWIVYLQYMFYMFSHTKMFSLYLRLIKAECKSTLGGVGRGLQMGYAAQAMEWYVIPVGSYNSGFGNARFIS